MTRWAMPPDISCGNALRRRSGSGMPTILSSSRDRPQAALPFIPRWIRRTSSIWRPTVPHRVERGRRLLEDHADPVAADLAHVLARELEQVLAVEQDLARVHVARAGDEPHDRQAGHALAAAGLADEAHDLAAVDMEVDAVDRADQAVAGLERRVEPLDLEQRALAAWLLLSPRARRDELLDDGLVEADAEGGLGTGRSASSSVQPRVERVAHAVAEEIEAEDGERDGHAREEDQVRRREEQVAVEARSSSPTRLSAAARRGPGTTGRRPRGWPHRSRACPATMSGVIAFGRIRRERMPREDSPSARDAVTKSCSRDGQHGAHASRGRRSGWTRSRWRAGVEQP